MVCKSIHISNQSIINLVVGVATKPVVAVLPRGCLSQGASVYHSHTARVWRAVFPPGGDGTLIAAAHAVYNWFCAV